MRRLVLVGLLVVPAARVGPPRSPARETWAVLWAAEAVAVLVVPRALAVVCRRCGWSCWRAGSCWRRRLRRWWRRLHGGPARGIGSSRLSSIVARRRRRRRRARRSARSSSPATARASTPSNRGATSSRAPSGCPGARASGSPRTTRRAPSLDLRRARRRRHLRLRGSPVGRRDRLPSSTTRPSAWPTIWCGSTATAPSPERPRCPSRKHCPRRLRPRRSAPAVPHESRTCPTAPTAAGCACCRTARACRRVPVIRRRAATDPLSTRMALGLEALRWAGANEPTPNAGRASSRALHQAQPGGVGLRRAPPARAGGPPVPGARRLDRRPPGRRAWNNIRCQANVAVFAEFTDPDCVLGAVGPRERAPAAGGHALRFGGRRTGTRILAPDADAGEQVAFALAARDGKLADRRLRRAHSCPTARSAPTRIRAATSTTTATIAIYDGDGSPLPTATSTSDAATCSRRCAGRPRHRRRRFGGIGPMAGRQQHLARRRPAVVWLSPTAPAPPRAFPLSDGGRHFNLFDVAVTTAAIVAHGFSDAPMTHSADGNNTAARTFGPLRIPTNLRATTAARFFFPMRVCRGSGAAARGRNICGFKSGAVAGAAAGCSSTRNGPPASRQPTRAIQVSGRAVAGATSVATGVACHPEKCVTRAPRIDARGGTEVLPEVEQHVDHARRICRGVVSGRA